MKTSVEILRENGIPASAQRVAIYDYVKASREHPSVDAVFGSLRGRIPTLSRTTVYSTLRLFCEKGLVFCVPGVDVAGMRFDGDLSPHAHFHCECCGGLFDVPGQGLALRPRGMPDGFAVRGARLLLTGLCPQCSKVS